MDKFNIWMVFVPMTIALMWVIGTLAGKSGRRMAKWLVVLMAGFFASILCFLLFEESFAGIVQAFEDITGTTPEVAIFAMLINVPAISILYGCGLFALTSRSQSKQLRIIKRAKAKARARELNRKVRFLTKEGVKFISA